MNVGLLFRPGKHRLFRQLHSLAESGDYDIRRLDDIRRSLKPGRCKETSYYLASLYLHLGEQSIANELLVQFDSASAAMKRFFHVLIYSKGHDLPIPKLTKEEEGCLEFLASKVNPKQNTFESIVLQSGAFSVVGNAPGTSLHSCPEGIRIYFNDYRSNGRIKEKADLHMVTPAWDIGWTGDSSTICITGNDIFYRRSRVWKKFLNHRNATTIYTMPINIWCALYKELGTSPSAGLLVLCWIESISTRYPKSLSGHVAGFSDGIPLVNHAYDSEPASKRHDWEAEAIVRNRIVTSLKSSCVSLSVEI